MKKYIIALVIAVLMAACSTTPNRLVYSSGFSFANYDYLIVSKPDGSETSTAMYGMDVEFANLMSRYNFRILGNKEFDQLQSEQKKRTLIARISMSAAQKRIMLTVSFDDAVTGKTGSSITTFTKGDIFDTKYRDLVFESASVTVVKALQADKGIIIRDDKKN